MHVLVCTHTINSSAYSNSMGTLFYLTTAASHYPLVHTTYKTSLMDGTNSMIFFNSSVSQRITCISWKPVCYHDHNSQLPVPIINQINPVQTLPIYLSSNYPFMYAQIFQVVSFPQVFLPKSRRH